MNRVIKFRGKSIKDGSWIYGSYVADVEWAKYYIFQKEKVGAFYQLVKHEVDEKTVGQFTGLLDKNGKEICEGDIVKSQGDSDWYSRGDIQFSHGVFGIEWFRTKKSKSMVGGWGQMHNLRRMDDDIVERIEVIGNIYENPNLLTQ